MSNRSTGMPHHGQVDKIVPGLLESGPTGYDEHVEELHQRLDYIRCLTDDLSHIACHIDQRLLKYLLALAFEEARCRTIATQGSALAAGYSAYDGGGGGVPRHVTRPISSAPCAADSRYAPGPP